MNQTFRLSLFQNKRDNKPQLVTRSWQQLCASFQKPQVRLEKDGLLFSPAYFEPSLRRKENVRELSLLVLDIDHNAELETLQTRLAALQCAFTIYSTHSHLQQTESNPEAESRFRVVMPLAEPIPSDLFPALWQHAKQATGLPLDEAAKDSSRIFYTPAIAIGDAPFCSYIHDAAFLDWRALPLAADDANDKTSAGNDDHKSAVYSFASHDERHAELCRLIQQCATRNTRGNYEMKCPAHNGKGSTSLFHDPENGAVACLKKPHPCSYVCLLYTSPSPRD